MMPEPFDTTEVMLTTVDNPFDPFTNFDEWNSYDIRLGYNTCAFLDRIAQVSDDLSEAEQKLALDQAIDEIVTENVSGMWVKVTRDGR
jgi:hypothetical protein